jgi:hypothetical protein
MMRDGERHAVLPGTQLTFAGGTLAPGGTPAPVFAGTGRHRTGGAEAIVRAMDHAGHGRRILEMMKPARAATRRHLPTSPFKPPPPARPAEQFAPQDQVTHDTYGLGRVIRVEDDTAVVVDFGTQQVRIAMPCAKLSKL